MSLISFQAARVDYALPQSIRELTACPINEQKETPEGLIDELCSLEATFNGHCRRHYIEHLVQIIIGQKVDPVAIFDVTQLEQVLKRVELVLPAANANPVTYKSGLIAAIKNALPI